MVTTIINIAFFFSLLISTIVNFFPNDEKVKDGVQTQAPIISSVNLLAYCV